MIFETLVSTSEEEIGETPSSIAFFATPIAMALEIFRTSAMGGKIEALASPLYGEKEAKI